MTQTPFDQLSKQYLEEFLAPLGTVQRQYEIPGEAKFVDVWFVPNQASGLPATDLGILGRMVQQMCLLEPFRKAPTRTDMRTSLLKLLWVQDDERRKTRQEGGLLSRAIFPQLWILAATASTPVIEDFGGKIESDWLPGIYFLPKGFHASIVAIDELPELEETLWLRILGRGETQERAIRAVLDLPRSHPKRDSILRLLASWKVRIDISEILDFSEQEALMALSEAFLAWEQETQTRSRQQEAQSLIIRQLSRRVGEIPDRTLKQIKALPIEQLEALGEALLDFTAISDLFQWLEQQS